MRVERLAEILETCNPNYKIEIHSESTVKEIHKLFEFEQEGTLRITTKKQTEANDIQETKSYYKQCLKETKEHYEQALNEV